MRLVQLFTLALIFAATQALPLLAQSTVPGGCPLPKVFKIKDAGTPGKKNPISMDAAFRGNNFSDAMDQNTVNSDVEIILEDQPNFEIKENDEPLKIDFEIPNFKIDAWAAGAIDPETDHRQDEHKWSPNDEYHSEATDKFPYKMFPCWKFEIENSYWTGAHVWKIEKAAHAYHFDGPTKYGVMGGIGDNGNEEGYSDEKGQVPEPMTYVVPSVPYYYFVSSGMTARWTWDFEENIHHWAHKGFMDRIKNGTTIPIPDGLCDICGQPKPDIDWPHPAVQKDKMTDLEPEEFYSNNAVQHVPEKPEEGYDQDGVSESIYDPEQGYSFKLPDQGTVITRAHVRVIDTKRIANLSFGDGDKAEWNTVVGHKLTEFEPTTIKFALYDNAPHMCLTPIFEDNIKRQGEDWAADNFKAIFWYENMTYDYQGFNNPVLGLGEVFYAPKLLLKRGRVWEGETGMEEFLRHGVSAQYKDGQDVSTDHNPQYVEWLLDFPTSELFSGEGGGDKEDNITWHYAKTALGDQFGNPRWEQGEYDGQEFNSYYGLAEKFKNKPLNFSNGRGALKCFFEITQTSKAENSLGGGHEKFICENEYFFHNLSKGDGTYQEQVTLNPENVQYIQKPGSGTVAGGSSVDATRGEGDLKKTDYGDCGDNWLANAKMQNGKDPKNFQAFGVFQIEDDRRPNVGLRVFNKSSNSYRNVYRINSIDKLDFYRGLMMGGGTRSLLRNDENKAPDQYQDDDEEWLFDQMPDGLGRGEDASDQGYGCFEDVDLELSHNDLKNGEKDGSVLCFYAHDNVDGQRIKYSAEVEKGYFYKGVECDGNMREQYPSSADGDSYAKNFINKGYKSWLVFDNTYSEQKMLENYRPDGNNFVYQNISFHNPNKKGDGSELNPGASDIHVSYQVRDRAGNTRKFRLNFFVKAIDVNINTLERHDRRYDED